MRCPLVIPIRIKRLWISRNRRLDELLHDAPALIKSEPMLVRLG